MIEELTILIVCLPYGLNFLPDHDNNGNLRPRPHEDDCKRKR